MFIKNLSHFLITFSLFIIPSLSGAYILKSEFLNNYRCDETTAAELTPVQLKTLLNYKNYYDGILFGKIEEIKNNNIVVQIFKLNIDNSNYISPNTYNINFFKSIPICVKSNIDKILANKIKLEGYKYIISESDKNLIGKYFFECRKAENIGLYMCKY